MTSCTSGQQHNDQAPILKLENDVYKKITVLLLKWHLKIIINNFIFLFGFFCSYISSFLRSYWQYQQLIMGFFPNFFDNLRTKLDLQCPETIKTIKSMTSSKFQTIKIIYHIWIKENQGSKVWNGQRWLRGKGLVVGYV